MSYLAPTFRHVLARAKTPKFRPSLGGGGQRRSGIFDAKRRGGRYGFARGGAAFVAIGDAMTQASARRRFLEEAQYITFVDAFPHCS